MPHSPLRRTDLNPDPIDQFSDWFKQACDKNITEPNAMSLATAGANLQPTVRTVLLKAFDARGFVFFTNLESKKATQISENNNVALMFSWFVSAEQSEVGTSLNRQVRIEGKASRISARESMKYFITRPLQSQLGAWASKQSAVLESRRALEAKLEEMKLKFAQRRIPLPSFWGGYRVRPELMEFWQAAPNRLDDHFRYSHYPDSTWSLHRLAP